MHITKKKFLFLAIILSVFRISASENLELNIEPSFGLRKFQLNEYTYLANAVYSDDTLSELEWKLKSELYAKINAELRWKFLFSEASFGTAVNGSKGTMYDSDWQNVQYAMNPFIQYKTNYSESDMKVVHDYSISIKTGGIIKVFKSLELKPSLGFEYASTKLDATGGLCFYGNSIGLDTYYSSVGPWNYYKSQNTSVFSVYGKVVSLERTLYNIWAGTEIVVTPFKKLQSLSFTAGLFTTPYMFSLTIDKHIQTGYKYAEECEGFFSAWKTYSKISYAINDRNSINLNFSYFYLSPIRGRDLYALMHNSSYTNNPAVKSGAETEAFEISLSWRYRIH